MRDQPVQLQLLAHAFLGEDWDVGLGLDPAQGRSHDTLAEQELQGRHTQQIGLVPQPQDDRLAIALPTLKTIFF